eukprot:391585-Prorocentrum_minimum.AAC.4
MARLWAGMVSTVSFRNLVGALRELACISVWVASPYFAAMSDAHWLSFFTTWRVCGTYTTSAAPSPSESLVLLKRITRLNCWHCVESLLRWSHSFSSSILIRFTFWPRKYTLSVAGWSLYSSSARYARRDQGLTCKDGNRCASRLRV